MGRKKGKNNENSTRKVIAGGITATVIILLVAFTNAIGYLGNAYVDAKNRIVWLIIAAVVFGMAGIIEFKKGGE